MGAPGGGKWEKGKRFVVACRLPVLHLHLHRCCAAGNANWEDKARGVRISNPRDSEPKDTLVSTWHFFKGIRPFTFSDLFELGCEGKTPSGPIWDHILGYWNASKATPERVLFLRYEDMLLDPVGHVVELARFLGRPFSMTADGEAATAAVDVVELCSFGKLKGVAAGGTGSFGFLYKFSRESLFRKGVVGDWVNHMTPEMARLFDAIVEDKLRGSGLSFK